MGWTLHNQSVNGQEMAEGSDKSGSELAGMEEDGGEYEMWSVVRGDRRKRKKQTQLNVSSDSEETDGEQNMTVMRNREDEHKVMVKMSNK